MPRPGTCIRFGLGFRFSLKGGFGGPLGVERLLADSDVLHQFDQARIRLGE